MIFLLSPSKTLDEETPFNAKSITQPELIKETKELLPHVAGLSESKLQKLMDISPKLAALNTQRYQNFKFPFTAKNARPAIFTFKGDVYEPMEVASYTPKQLEFAQTHMRILSGLYGLLRPLDLMQPYRLEMGTQLKNPRGKDLYAFWGDRITRQLNAGLAKEKTPVLINLASEEYFKSVHIKEIQGKLLNVSFKERHKGSLKIIGIHAKKARGMMADFIIKNQIDTPDKLKKFQGGGYAFDAKLSGESEYIFVR